MKPAASGLAAGRWAAFISHQTLFCLGREIGRALALAVPALLKSYDGVHQHLIAISLHVHLFVHSHIKITGQTVALHVRICALR